MRNPAIVSVRSEIDDIRDCLAGSDVDALPNDYPTYQMARDRMDDLQRLRAENARLKAALIGIYDAFEELSNADVDKSVKELARGVIQRANRWQES